MSNQRLRPPTARDVAEMAGVSTAVVSYVMSGRSGGKDRISEETRERVRAAVRAVGYVPNQTARSLRRQKTERVCLVLPRLGTPFHDVIAEELMQAAEANGYSVIISINGSVQQEAMVINQLRRGMADGVVFMPRYSDATTDVEALTAVAESGTAVVVLSEYISSKVFDIFRTTDAAGCYEAVSYLIEQGHRRIGFVGHLSRPSALNERLESYLRALRDHNMDVDDELIRGGAGQRDKAYRSAVELLHVANRPTAIFVTADLGAVGAIHAIRDAGLRVPEDVAVIGVGNIPEGATLHPTLTTVGTDPLQFKAVSEMLFSRLNGTAPAEGRVHTQQWGLILRGST